MQGVTILEIYIDKIPAILLIIFTILAICLIGLGPYGLVEVIRQRFPFFAILLCILSLLMGGIIIKRVVILKDYSVTSYKVKVDEDVLLTEFAAKYKIEKQLKSNDIWIVSEK